jgi:transcriptional regulator with GAF, ATPase, and Fis domain
MKGRRFLDRFQNFFENLESDDPNEVLFYILNESIRLVWDELTEKRQLKIDKILILYQENYIVANADLDEKDDSYKFSRTVAEDVVKSNKSFLSKDIKSDAEYKNIKILKSLDTQSFLCVPLRFLGKCFGAIYVDSTTLDGFSERDVDFMEDFSWILSPYIYGIREFCDQMFSDGKEDVKIIGESPVLKSIMNKVDEISSVDTPVLLEGEKGTGKELIAQFIHSRSSRKKRSFLAVDCAAIHSNRLESEIFGHERGAFTGAYGRKLGKYELAYGGTFFLNEVAVLDSVLQTKLLRALEEKKIVRVGGIKTIPVDTRIIVSTNRNLKLEVEQGRFRKDLYNRLNAVSIQIPPLRERREDIPLLVKHFSHIFGEKAGKKMQVSPEVVGPLERYPWYGNVREMKNVIERMVLQSEGENLERMVLQSEGENLQFFNLPYEIRNFAGEEKPLSQTVRAKGSSEKKEPAQISNTWQAIQGKRIERTEKRSKDKTE